jgi:tetratricopeptide (TPR) repeat protein
VKKLIYPVLLFFLYLSVLLPFTSYMKSKPYGEMVGVVPKGDILKFISADQKEFIAATMIMKVLSYYGGVVDKSFNKLGLPVDHPAMSRSLHAAVKLDPYNMDAYYFAQATLVWDAKQVPLANELLEYGMQHRNWDFYLPFFVGFNYAYFLKDFAKAAEYYKRAGDLSGSELFINLAGRYLYESGKSKMAIDYLTVMEKSASTPAIKKTFQTRLQAIKEGHRIELARDRYMQEIGRMPGSIDELIQKGYLVGPLVDPYGGSFYFEPDGTVRSTSKFAFGVAGKN